ncbi:hypothetical protein BDZ97DRAFT_270605 [Flammula alnicola]|nr:hypothetical protein BDZ97DRAFT_270605 [Flammula alnicola]
MRYIQSPLLRPDDCLKVILGLSAIPDDDRPYGQLDDLYIYIFKSTPDKHKKSIKLIFDILVIPRSNDDNLGAFTTPAMLNKLLLFPPGHVEHILGNFLCLVNLHGSDKPIEVLHASLADFLLDLSRSGEFYADMGRAHEALTKGYTKLILDAKPNEFHSMVNSYYLLAKHHSKRAFLSGLEQDQAYASLDELYIHIFSSAPTGLKGSLTLNFTALALLAFPDHNLSNGFQTQAIKEKLLSLSPSYDEYVRSHLYFLVDHPLQISDHSVLEFFLTPHRSGKLGVNVAHGHEFLARRYAALIRDESSESMTDTWYYPLHFIYHSERAFLSGDLEKELEEFDLADIYRTLTNGNRVFDGVWTMVITILNSFFHLLQRKEITNGQSLFDDQIELLEQCILSPRRGLPDIDLDLYSAMLDRIRSRYLVYDCSGPARSGGYPCNSCQTGNIRGASEAVYKLKILVAIAWYSSMEYWMDSTTPFGLKRAQTAEQCLRFLQTLDSEDIRAHRDSVAIHLELALTSLIHSSYSSSLVDRLASFDGSTSDPSAILLTELSKNPLSELSALTYAVLHYIQVS